MLDYAIYIFIEKFDYVRISMANIYGIIIFSMKFICLFRLIEVSRVAGAQAQQVAGTILTRGNEIF